MTSAEVHACNPTAQELFHDHAHLPDAGRRRRHRGGRLVQARARRLELWSLGPVVGLEIDGAPFFLHEPTAEGFGSPASGSTTVRVEVFVDDPDAFVRRAIEAGADGSMDEVRDHQVPWGIHRQGGFRDPCGHI
jgi:hypothetical protein